MAKGFDGRPVPSAGGTCDGAPEAPERRDACESTASLFAHLRAGDATARERLVRRFLPPLRRWAHGRLPAAARGMLDTDDLVQVTLLRALERVESFELQRPGAFLAYLRRILLNALRDELRRAARRPRAEALPEDLVDQAPSLVEQAIGREAVAAYERALAMLPAPQQEAVILRLEFGFTYQEIAEAIGSPSANAARMTVSRAVLRLAEVMDGHQP